jgi:aminomethyltransferase
MFTGPSAQDFLMSLTPSSLGSLAPFSSTLSVLLNENGGIIDDTIITKHSEDQFYVVTNAGRAKEDKAHLDSKLKEWNAKPDNKGKEVKWETMDGWGLVALQGPKSAQVLQGLTDVDLSAIKFGQSVYAEIEGVKCHIARGGYTGEDGFEVSFKPLESERVRSMRADDADFHPTSERSRHHSKDCQ